MRDRITRELIDAEGLSLCRDRGRLARCGGIDHYVRHFEYPPSEWTAFARFPIWMWRNTRCGFRRLAARAQWPAEAAERVAFHGLDLYSLYTSIRAVLRYLDEVDPERRGWHANAMAA